MTISSETNLKIRILVVDDDVMLSAAMRRALCPEHELVTESNAAEALKRLKQGEQFDLIMCDLMMPGMSGMDFYTEFSRVDPDLAKRVVFMTGGAFTARAQDFLRRVPNARIEKPFELRSLRDLVRDTVGHWRIDNANNRPWVSTK